MCCVLLNVNIIVIAIIPTCYLNKHYSENIADGDDISQVTSEELSGFYKDFLDKKYSDQMIFTRYSYSHTDGW